MEKAGMFLADIFNLKNDSSIFKSRLNKSYIRSVDAKSEEE